MKSTAQMQSNAKRPCLTGGHLAQPIASVDGAIGTESALEL
jgi:hypothetical protein